jgi:hypothetical protein
MNYSPRKSVMRQEIVTVMRVARGSPELGSSKVTRGAHLHVCGMLYLTYVEGEGFRG